MKSFLSNREKFMMIFQKKLCGRKKKLQKIKLKEFFSFPFLPFHHHRIFINSSLLPYSTIALWHFRRKKNLLNWLLLLFRSSDFYIRHQQSERFGGRRRDGRRDMCMGGEFMTFIEGLALIVATLRDDSGVSHLLCGYVKCVWLIKGYCQLLNWKSRRTPHDTQQPCECRKS